MYYRFKSNHEVITSLTFQFSANTDIPFYLGNLIRGGKIKALGRADADTGWFQALINSIHAVVALDRLLRFRVPLDRTPRAGRNTCLAAVTVCLANKNNAVVRPDLNGSGFTVGHAYGFFAMVARDKNIGGARQLLFKLEANAEDLAGFGSHGK